MELTGIVLAKNEELWIARALTCLRKFDEVLLYDTGSTDKTVRIAEMLGVRVHPGIFDNDYSKLRNDATLEASNDYVFFLDADEFIDPFVYDELISIFSGGGNVVIQFPRYNSYDGKTFIPRFYPDYQKRAFSRKYAYYVRPVHEILSCKNEKLVTSSFHLFHRGYRDLEGDIADYIIQCRINGNNYTYEVAKERFIKAYADFDQEKKSIPGGNK